ncbi:MAG: hypothetical protein V4558_06380 [Gemmatimonadota bacterium]
MITKDQLAHAMMHECDVCIHLATKFTPEGYGYRPSPGQRNTVELMQYLSFAMSTALGVFRDGDWSVFRAAAEAAKSLTPAEFPAAMLEEKAAIKAFFDGLTEEQLEHQEATLPGGRGKAPLGVAILGGPFSWLPAYKLQLFLYAKAAGAADIGTSNAWRGVDMPPKA